MITGLISLITIMLDRMTVPWNCHTIPQRLTTDQLIDLLAASLVVSYFRPEFVQFFQFDDKLWNVSWNLESTPDQQTFYVF